MRLGAMRAVCAGALAAWSIAAAGAERDAYMYRTDGTLVRVSLPATPPAEVQFVEPVVVADLSSSCIFIGAGSTWWPDGRILTPSVAEGAGSPARLCSLDPVDGSTEMLTTMPIDVWPDDDLVLSPGGQLIFIGDGPGSSSMFYILDPVTGAVQEQGEVSPPCTTVELHQGEYYAACWDAFFSRIDPTTLETTQIVPLPPFVQTQITGLSSAGGELWYLTESYNPPVVWPAEIGTIDPVTGERTAHVRVAAGWIDAFSFLEVSEQVTSEPVPAVRPIGMVVLVALLVAAALMALRRM